MMKKLTFLMIGLAIMSWACLAEADIVCLKNGNIIEGIIVKDADKVLELEIFLNSKIILSREDIAYVKRWGRVENQALREKWFKDKVEREEAELARQEFEAEQKAKGLVQYQGEWIPQAEKDKLKTREYIDELLREKTGGEIVKFGNRKRTEVARTLLAKGDWQYRRTEHFIVYYDDVIQSKIVADRAEYYYEKISYDLNYEKAINWTQRCEVFIVPSKKKWEEYMQPFLDRFDHIGGFVPQTGEKEIYLCALSLPYLSVIFPHELTHLIFNEFAEGKYIPLWLSEGLAIYESGLIGFADEMLRDKVEEVKHIPINKLTAMKSYPKTKEEMELFYAQAEKTVEFLITQHGRKKFSQFCQYLISGQTFAKGLELVYVDNDYNEDEFEQAWIKYVLK